MNRPEWLKYDDENIKKESFIKTGYLYDTKINNINVYKKEYNDKNIIVSKKYEINKFFRYLTLTTDEEINKSTDIEYYISFVDVPSAKDWIPILPNEKTEVTNERLFFENYGEATLRFEEKDGVDLESIKVFKNGIEIDFEKHIDTSGKILLLIEKYSPFYIYTASYKCNKNNIVLDNTFFSIKDKVETFENTDNDGKVILNTPYYTSKELNDFFQEEIFEDETNNLKVKITSKEGISGPYDVAFVDGGEPYKCTEITQDNCSVVYPSGEKDIKDFPRLLEKNITNDKSFVFQPYNNRIKDNGDMLYPYIEFARKDQEIYFSEFFNELSEHGNGNIIAQYKYVYIPIRIKAILRNNTKDKSCTPILKSYKINIY